MSVVDTRPRSSLWHETDDRIAADGSSRSTWKLWAELMQAVMDAEAPQPDGSRPTTPAQEPHSPARSASTVTAQSTEAAVNSFLDEVRCLLSREDSDTPLLATSSAMVEQLVATFSTYLREAASRAALLPLLAIVAAHAGLAEADLSQLIARDPSATSAGPNGKGSFGSFGSLHTPSVSSAKSFRPGSSNRKGAPSIASVSCGDEGGLADEELIPLETPARSQPSGRLPGSAYTVNSSVHAPAHHWTVPMPAVRPSASLSSASLSALRAAPSAPHLRSPLAGGRGSSAVTRSRPAR